MFNEGATNVEENIYGHVYGEGGQDSSELRRIELTQAEFGEAFGMKPNSTFVKHMFLLVDSDKSGRVSFKEFMDIFIQLSSGTCILIDGLFGVSTLVQLCCGSHCIYPCLLGFLSPIYCILSKSLAAFSHNHH